MQARTENLVRPILLTDLHKFDLFFWSSFTTRKGRWIFDVVSEFSGERADVIAFCPLVSSLFWICVLAGYADISKGLLVDYLQMFVNGIMSTPDS
jgi:hypothetical protein